MATIRAQPESEKFLPLDSRFSREVTEW